jgi:hypothetical protein
MEETNSQLYNHIKKEQLLSVSSYKELTSSMSCDKDTTVYRGLSFRTKKEYNKFKKILDSGEYTPKLPESFSTIKNTAIEFARNKKTLFCYEDNNILLENSYKNITNENISVYAGIVIKLVVPKGKGVDVNKSKECLEDEIIYYTHDKLDYTYEVIESFENKLKNNPIDINKYIEENGIKDNFSKYIMSNHSKELNKETQSFILSELLEPQKLTTPSVNYHINENKRVIVTERQGSLLDNEDMKITFDFENILKYYKDGILTDSSVLDRIEKEVSQIVEDICEFVESEYNYGDRDCSVHYDLANVMKLSHLANDKQRERLGAISYMASPRDHNTINEEIRSLNLREDLSYNEKNKIAQRKSEEIKDFLLNIINNVPKDKAIVEKEIKLQKEKNEEIKKRVKKLRKQ